MDTTHDTTYLLNELHYNTYIPIVLASPGGPGHGRRRHGLPKLANPSPSESSSKLPSGQLVPSSLSVTTYLPP